MSVTTTNGSVLGLATTGSALSAMLLSWKAAIVVALPVLLSGLLVIITQKREKDEAKRK